MKGVAYCLVERIRQTVRTSLTIASLIQGIVEATYLETPMDRIEAMRSFVHVVEQGSFTRAATTLGRHKATVSDQVALLERLLGVHLLTRTTRNVVPTAEGLLYARKAAAILAQIEEADATVRVPLRHPQGMLRVELPTPIGHMVVIPEVHTFLARYPGITLDLSCTDRLSNLVQEGVDCVVRAGELPDSSLVCRKLCDLDFALFASPIYLARAGIPREPADLAGHQRVGYRTATASRAPSVRLTRGNETVELDMPMRLIVSDVSGVTQAAVAGLGIVEATSFTLAQHLRAATLVRVLPDWQGRTLPLSLLATSNRFRTARVQVFMDWMQDLLHRNMAPL
jgi:LysR family transcriptional regulator, regulator for bpeEF and oprC